jgi:hypothetical protein
MYVISGERQLSRPEAGGREYRVGNTTCKAPERCGKARPDEKRGIFFSRLKSILR